MTKHKTNNALSAEGQASSDTEALRQEALLRNIAELGGKGMKEEDIVYQGDKVVLPSRWRGDIHSAIDYLETKRDEEEEISVFTRAYNFRPWDGAFNAIQAMKKAFGMVSGKTIHTMFGAIRPTYIQIPTGVTTSEEVPWGKFEIPLLKKTTFTFGSTRSKDYGQIFEIRIEAPRKERFVIEGLFKLIAEELAANSIYRGKAVDGQEQPAFLDLRGFDPSKVVYSEQVQSDLDAHLWGVLRYSEANRELGLSLKRSLLLTGPYGTGKSLAGFRTALEAQKAGWTFIMARPGRDSFTDVMQTARLYQPAVVFMEDVDTVAKAENEGAISELLDLFDGIQAKNTDLVVVLTTNHPELLHKGMMRPGRLDAIIEINALDASGIERLMRTAIDAKRLADDLDFVPVVKACEGYMPAFVKEAADRAVRYALARSEGNIGDYIITTADLVHAATGLRPQFERMQEAPEHAEKDQFVEGFAAIVRQENQKVLLDLAADNDMAQYGWNTERLDELREQRRVDMDN